MSYPQYPGYPQSPMPYPGPPSGGLAPPDAVKRAVGLMYAGAGFSVVYSAAVIVTLNSLFTTDSARPASFHAGYVAGLVIEGLIQVSLWLWMAWKTKAGRSWARVVSTVLFGLMCLQVLVVLVGHSPVPKIAAGAEWIVGISALILLWQRESSTYFSAVSAAGSNASLPAPGYPPAGYPPAGYGYPSQPQPYGQPPNPPYGQPPQGGL